MKIKIALLTTLSLMIALACFNLSLAQSSSQATAQETKDISQLILKDKQVQEDGVSTEDVAKGISVKKIDLNNDGQPEFIVVLEGPICGAHENCPNWVYRKTGSEYQLLLRTMGQRLILQKTSTNGFTDLRSDGGDTAFEGSFVNYKFDGNKYQAKECYTRTYATKTQKEKITPVKCEENTSSSNESQQLRRYNPQMHSAEQSFGQEKITISLDKSIALSTRQALIRYISQHYVSRVIEFEINELPGADTLYVVTGIFDKAQQAKAPQAQDNSSQAPTILLVLRQQGDTVSEVSKVENENGGAYGLISSAFFLGQNKLLMIVSFSAGDGADGGNYAYEYADHNFKSLGQIDVIEKVGMSGSVWLTSHPIERATAEYKNNTYYVTMRGAKGGLYGGSADAKGNPRKLASAGSPVTFFYDGANWKQQPQNR